MSSAILRRLTPPADVHNERPYTAEQNADIEEIATHYNAADFAIEGTPLTQREQMFLSKETIDRFRLSSTDVPHTITRLDAALRWRREQKVDDVEAMAAKIRPEMKSGKVFLLGFTKTGQPVMYVFHPRNDVPSAQRDQVPAIFFLERSRDLQANGTSTIFVFQNYGVPSLGDKMTPSFAKENMQIVADYYAHHVGKAVLQDMSFMIRTFINLIWPFVDSWTQKVTVFDKSNKPIEDIPADEILKETHGELDYKWDVDEYWPVLLAVTNARRADQEKRFADQGLKVGAEEKLFKVAEVPVTL